MAEHISTVQMRHFSARTLPAPELLALAAHLAACGACLTQFQQTRRAHGADAPLSFTLAPEAWLKHEHLQYEQLTPYLDGSLDGEEREILEHHLRGCAGCREDVQSLREFRRQIAPELSVSYAPTEHVSEHKLIRPVSGWFGWRWQPAYAAAAVVVLVIALVATLSLRNRRAGEQQAQVLQPASEGKVSSSEKNPIGASQITANDNAASAASIAQPNSNSGHMTSPAVKSPRSTPTQVQGPPKQRGTRNQLNSTITVAELNDGDQKITIDSAGHVTRLNRLTPTDVQAVKATLLAQNMTRPAELAELVGEQGTLRGNPVVGQSFRLLAPARAVTANERPTFKWAAMPGATSYRVFIGDADNREVASSGELLPSVTEWAPRTPLPRGQVYTWAVIAESNGNDVIAPAASQPEMKFKVLSADALQELTTLQHSARSHLAMGIFYVRVGMLAEAEMEFRSLVRQNPKSPIALKLLRRVQSWR